MGIFYNCIHWRVCALPCPLEIEQCKHYKQDTEKHGHWVSKALWFDEHGTKHEKLMCNLCGFTHEFLDDHTAQYRYCTQCGARMDESEGEK